ncbi:cupin domain-containing protein [Promicromonospora sp. NPDC019610]|uniref:AraC family transcriptional regulator n=1 Tax=Promicromonospora sp. NPDC019610 TaxID=3364405 RepID=UPI0037926467
MDLLDQVLMAAGVRGVLGARIDAAESWGISWNPLGTAAFYAVTSGTAWLGLPGRPPEQLMPGDVVLLRAGTAHTLSSDPDAAVGRCSKEVAELARAQGAVLRFGSGEPHGHILGAAYEHDPAVSIQVLDSLPEIVHLRAEHGGSSLDDTVRLLARELAHPQIASTTVLGRLVDILLVQLLRVWLSQNPPAARNSWLAALSDPLVSDAMSRLHGDPARPWTTDLLAAELAISRTTLARKFQTVAHETPGRYLTRLRMDLAAVRLRDTDDGLEAIARAVGYTSVYAFSRAFRKDRQQAPGSFRRAARAEAEGPGASTH